MNEITLSQFKIISQIVDPELGVIEEIAPIGLQPSEKNLHIAVGVTQNPSAISPLSRDNPGPRNDRQAAGAGLDFKTTIWSTIGESLERYSASIIDPELISISKAADLDGIVLSPSEFVRFSKEQYSDPDFPFLQYDAEEPIAWVKGLRVVSGKEVWIPADYVYLAHAGGNTRLDKGYSTGLGAHRIPARAASAAIKELIERDAYMSRYLTNLKPPEIPERIMQRMLGQLLNDLKISDVSIRAFDLTNEFSLPTALCHIFLPGNLGIASGASCQLTASACLEKAAIECLHTYNWLIDMNRWNISTEHNDIKDFVDHVSYHRNSDAAKRYAQFLNGVGGIPMMDVEQYEGSDTEEFEYIVSRIEDAGHAVYIIDVTSTDIEELGFYVFRAVIPSLQPIYAGNDMIHLDKRRLRQVAQNNNIAWDDIMINTHPHPFP